MHGGQPRSNSAIKSAPAASPSLPSAAQPASLHGAQVVPTTTSSVNLDPPSVTPVSSTAPEIASVNPSADLGAVNELIGSMKHTLQGLGSAFDALGNQTVRLAELRSSLNAAGQVRLLREQISKQRQRQEDRMQQFGDSLSQDLHQRIHSDLSEQVAVLTKQLVQQAIVQRVRHQLTIKIPHSLREEITEYRRRILSVKISLHNSEARRHNALIRSSSLDESLHPLLRPLHLSPLKIKVDEPIPLSSFFSSSKPAGFLSLPTSPLMSETHEPVILHSELEDDCIPTPSPLFPSNLTSLFQLEPDTLRMLMSDYDLINVIDRNYNMADGPKLDGLLSGRSPTTVVIQEEAATTEESISQFMSFIGIALHLLPDLFSQAKRASGRPAVLIETRLSYLGLYQPPQADRSHEQWWLSSEGITS